MMSDAWMIRYGERQRLVENLQRKLWDKLEDLEDQQRDIAMASFPFDLASVIVEYFRCDQKRVAIRENSDAARFFIRVILFEIVKFARSESEKNVMVADFLEKVITGATQSHRNNLLREEMMTPEKIFSSESK